MKKNLNKILSLLIAMIMVCSALSVVPFSASAAENIRTYYFEDTLGWGEVYAYTWYTNGDSAVNNTSWPGEKMTYYSTDQYGYDVYYINVPANMEYIIFTNYQWNSDGQIYDQTVDIPLTNAVYKNSIFKLNGVDYYEHRYNGYVPLYNYRVDNAEKYISVFSDYLISQESQGNSSSENSGNIEIDNEELTDLEVTLASDVNIKIPGDVPIIGGGELKLDTSFVPIYAKMKANKIYIGIGFSNSENLKTKDWDNTWCSVKNYVNGYKSNIEKGKSIFGSSAFGKASAGIGRNFNFKIAGYYEGTLKDGKIVSSQGMAQIDLSASLSKEWQTAVGPVPVVLKIKGEVSAENKLHLSFDTNSCKLNFTNDLKLTLPKINASAGVGISKIADVSVYGEGRNELEIKNNFSSLKGTLYGELGVSAKLFMFSGKLPILKNKDGWTYYDSTKKSVHPVSSMFDVDDIDFSIDRTYADKQSGWLQESYRKNVFSVAASLDNTEYTILQSSVYNNAKPQIVKADDYTLMVWTGDDTSRTTGNQTVVYYSIYDQNTNIWSVPVAVDDNGTADFYPSVATDGVNTFIAWTDTNTKFDENITVDEMAVSCEIKVAEFNKDSGVFENIHKLTDNSMVDIKPCVSVSDGNATVVWKSNTDNSMLDFSGIDKIYYAQSDNDFQVNLITASENQIYDVVCSGNNVAYIADKFANSGDVEIYSAEIGKNPVKLTDNEINEYNIKFSTINGTEYLTYQADGIIYGTDDMSNVSALTDSKVKIMGDYRFVSNEGTTELISTEAVDESTEILSYSQDNNRVWSNPIFLTHQGKYIRGASAVLDNNDNIQLVYMCTTASIASDDVNESTDLCTQIIGNTYDITVNSVDYDNEAVAEGAILPATVNITNNGTLTENNVNIEVFDKDNSLVMSESVEVFIASGESKDITVNVPLPESLDRKHSYTVNVSSNANKDANDSDNSILLEFGYTSLQLNTQNASEGSNTGVMIKVDNFSCISTGMMLIVKTDNADGEVLDTFQLEDIGANSETHYFLDYDYIREYKEKTDIIYLELFSHKDEETLADNTATVNISGIRAPKKSEYNIKVNCDEYQSAHNYSNGCDENWIIYKEDASSISITFSSLTELESDCDYIYIYDSNDNQIGKYTGTALAGRTVTVTGDAVKIRLTSDFSVNKYGFALTEISSAYKIIFEVGDANMDSSITVEDVTYIQKYLVDMVSFDEQQLIIADTDSDKTIDIRDATLIQKYVAGFISFF